MTHENAYRAKREDNGTWITGYLVPRSIIVEPQSLALYWIATGIENECYPVVEGTIEYIGNNNS